jgi:sensor histidine kinase YesM
MHSQTAVTSIDSISYSQKNGETATSAQHSGARLSAFAVIWCITAALALVTAYECHSITDVSSLVYGIAQWAWWALIASTLWKLGVRTPLVTSFTTRAISIHITVAAALGVVHLWLLWGVGYVTLGVSGYMNSALIWQYLMNVNRYGIEILIYGFVFGIIGIIQHEMRAQREKVRSLELERQLSAAQLRALQMQLEPHFLFNTLNAITTLVELGRQQQATEMLSHLNAILKSTLKRTAPEKVPLSQEIEIVENYLAIEQVRFADRLRIEIKVEPGALDSLVPCFLLQPIVENAIRHGIAHCESNGVVEASARREGNLLRLEVRNNGSHTNASSKPGNGIGLRNTRERLTHFYRDAFDMQAAPLAAGGFQVAIAIPYERR